MKDEGIKLSDFYFATIEGEDEEGNIVYGEKKKIDGLIDIDYREGD